MPTHRTPPDPVPARAENVAHNSNPPTSPASVENFSPTPGPWVIRENPIGGIDPGRLRIDSTAFGEDKQYQCVCKLYGSAHDLETRSNARLIHAAPAMLTLLRELRGCERRLNALPSMDTARLADAAEAEAAAIGKLIALVDELEGGAR